MSKTTANTTRVSQRKARPLVMNTASPLTSSRNTSTSQPALPTSSMSVILTITCRPCRRLSQTLQVSATSLLILTGGPWRLALSLRWKPSSPSLQVEVELWIPLKCQNSSELSFRIPSWPRFLILHLLVIIRMSASSCELKSKRISKAHWITF